MLMRFMVIELIDGVSIEKVTVRVLIQLAVALYPMRGHWAVHGWPGQWRWMEERFVIHHYVGHPEGSCVAVGQPWGRSP